MAEQNKIEIHLGEEEKAPPPDDSVFGSESETEDGSSEKTPVQESCGQHGDNTNDSKDGCFKFIKGIKVIVKGIKKKPDLFRAASSKSSLSSSASGSLHQSSSGSLQGSVSGSDADLPSVRGSVSEPLPINIPNYYDTDEYFFDYPKRGYAVIINNEKFEPGSTFEDRGGTTADEGHLRKIFKKLSFRVKTYRNLQGMQIVDKLEKMADRDHSDKDCFVCAILTHGGQQTLRNSRGVEVNYDLIFGVDGVAVSMRYLLDIFSDDNCPTLEYKPRLFFIQACRGNKYDLGKSVEVYQDLYGQRTSMVAAGGDVADAKDPDAEVEDMDEEQEFVPVNVSVPLYRDFLVAYGTPPGHYAWRRHEGSWFINSLNATVTEADLQKDSLMDILAKCSWHQAMNFSSRVIDPDTGKVIRSQSYMKAVPHITHMLTKSVFFTPKPKASQ